MAASTSTDKQVQLPSVGKVLAMELVELMEVCDELDIDTEEFVSEQQFQSAILEHMKGTANFATSSPPFGQAAKNFSREVEMKRRQLLGALDAVQQFVSKKEVKQWLKKLKISKLPCWMKTRDFSKARQKLQGKPVLLVAGGTSAGKTTLINALLGESVLPSAHNATTSVLCEIKYSGAVGVKYAIVHLERKGKKQTERVHLSDSLGVAKLTAYLNGARKQGDKAQPAQEEDWKCSHVEVFWPLEFLKDFTLVDSPGVTEEEGESVARRMTEQFQCDFACGYIYVLDATQAAEEASQVGGLLKTVMEATQSSPLAGSALFVVNKWDMLIQQQNEEEQEEFLAKVAYNISRRWPGFNREHQLLTMNARLAAQAQELGTASKDMQNLCSRVGDMLPIGMDNMLLKSIRQPVEVLNVTEHTIDATVRELCLPDDERMMKQTEDWEKLKAFRHSMECGKLAEALDLLDGKMQEMAFLFLTYLKSKDSLKHAIEWKESTDDLQGSNIGNIAKKIIIQTITEHPEYKKACTWADKRLSPIVDDVYQEFLLLPGADAFAKGSNLLDDLIEEEKLGKFAGFVDSDNAERVGWVIGALLPISWPFWLVAAITGPIGYAISHVMGSSSDDSDDLPVGVLGFTPALPAIAVSQAIGSFTGSISESVSNSSLKRKCRKAVMKGYKRLISRLCESDGKLLRELLKRLLQNAVRSVKMIVEDIPDQLQDLEAQLRVRVQQQAKDVSSYVSVLQNCQSIKRSLLTFILQLTATSEGGSMEWIQSKTPIRHGRFGPLFMIERPEQGAVTLELIDIGVVEARPDDILSVKYSRRLLHKNLVAIFGLVRLSDKPLQVCLLYEWCEGGTVVDEFIGDGKRTQANHPAHYGRAQSVVQQIFSGLLYLHRAAIVHGYLRPEGIWVSGNGTVKIAEVGMARLGADSSLRSAADLFYVAPEIIHTQPYSFPADIFSIGVIMWEIWNGQRIASASLTAEGSAASNGQSVQDKVVFICPDLDPSSDSTEKENSFAVRWKDLACNCWAHYAKLRPTAEISLHSAERFLDV